VRTTSELDREQRGNNKLNGTGKCTVGCCSSECVSLCNLSKVTSVYALELTVVGNSSMKCMVTDHWSALVEVCIVSVLSYLKVKG